MGPSPRCAATGSAASPNTCLTMASPILESITVHTGAGILMLELHVEGNRVESVRVNMGPPTFSAIGFPSPALERHR